MNRGTFLEYEFIGIARKMRNRRGFTLIELLIVVTIIGIITAIAVVNMINAIQRAKQKSTMASMKSLATGIEAFATDRNFYPAAAALTLPPGLELPTATLGAAAGMLGPTYLRVVPVLDGWNSYFMYGSSPQRTDFALRSAGADGLPDSTPAGGATTTFNSDIILVDGTFVQFPEGAQK